LLNEEQLEINTINIDEFDASEYITRSNISYDCTTTVVYESFFDEDCSCEYIQVVSTETNCNYNYYNSPEFVDIGASDQGGEIWGVFSGTGGNSSGGTVITSPLDNLIEECVLNLATELGVSFDEISCLNNDNFSSTCVLNTEISDYLDLNQINSNPNPNELGFSYNDPVSEEIALLAIESFCNNECAILPTIENGNNTSSTYTGDIGDEQDQTTQLDHEQIKQQYEIFIENNDNVGAINYLINSYSMEFFSDVNVTGNYTFSFVEGDSPEAITTSTFSSNGIFESSVIQINEGLLTYSDFGWISRALKHELFHVLQAKFYPFGATTNIEREFEAYWYSIYRFPKLPRGDDASETRWAYRVRDFYNSMTVSQKALVSDKWMIFLNDYKEICNED